jgi:methylmalonyl-CoA/ethylmalonyl-CoA epimerase
MNRHNLRPHHVGISVANMAESIDWYERILDFKLEWCRPFPPIKTHIAFLTNGNFNIELFEAYNSKPQLEERRLPITDLQMQGTKHIAFEVKDIKTLFEHFNTEGVDIVFGPIESPPKDGLFGFIRDPSGVLIEFLEKYDLGNDEL